MKRFLFLFFALILVISIFAILMHNNGYGGSAAETVLKAFDVTGADAVASEIYIRGRTEHGLGAAGPVELLKEIVAGAGMLFDNELPVFNTVDTDMAEGQEISYIIDENKSIRMTVLKEINDTEDDNEKNRHDLIFISFIDTSRRPDLQKNCDAVTDVLDKYKAEYQINVSLTGCIEKKLSDAELDNMFENVFRSARAEKVEGISDNGLVSVSAFSPAIAGGIRADGKRVNLNIAARYNSYENKTYIWLATPVIITEY